MALKETADQTSTGSLLEDFKFSNDSEFFGIKESEIDASTETFKEVKTAAPKGQASTPTTEIKKVEVNDPDDEDEEEATAFGEWEGEPKEVKEVKTKPATTKEKVEGEDEEEEEEEVVTTTAKKEGEEEKTTTPEEEDARFYTTLASELKEKGIFQNVEIKEDQELTEEQFFELQDAEVEARLEDALKELLVELDDDGKAFVKFKKSGGRTQDFLIHYASGGLDIDEFDENNPQHVSKVLTHYITTHEKVDADELQDRLTYIKDSGKEKAKAAKWFGEIKAEEEEKKKTILKAQETAAKTREDNAKLFKDEISKIVEKSESLGAFTLSAEDKRELTPYITRGAIKVGTNRYIPKFNADLANILKAETPETKQQLLILAKLVKTNFDVSDLTKTTKTKVVAEVRSKLKDAKKGVKPATSGTGNKRSLSDFFN
jgi:hypothetical protein